MARRKPWAGRPKGEYGYTVVACERESGSKLYLRFRDPETGRRTKHSLGHRDRKRAQKQAGELADALELRETPFQVTLGGVLKLYQRHKTLQKKPPEQVADRRRAWMFERFFGQDKDPHRFGERERDSFMAARLGGAIDARGEIVAKNHRKKVRQRAAEADWSWLFGVFRWASMWREGTVYVMRENPLRGAKAEKEKNPRRPVCSDDRYEAMLEKAPEIMMEIRWHGKREPRPSYLPELLTLAGETGRRLSAVRQLHTRDLRLGYGEFGGICWPEDSDKEDKQYYAPLTPAARKAIDRILAERRIGHLFPKPTDPNLPMTRHQADTWLRKALAKTEFPPLDGSLWHAIRRRWVTKRKHHPLKDIAAAGGWASIDSLKHYMGADEDTMQAVVFDARPLPERAVLAAS